MSHDHGALVAQFRETLTQRRYNPVVVHNYCRNADHFLSYLRKRKIALEVVTPTEVSNYLCLAVRQFRKRHGRAHAPRWASIPRSGIHGLLKLALKRWPPEPKTSDTRRTPLWRSVPAVPDMVAGGARASSRIDRCIDVGGSAFLRLVHRECRQRQLHEYEHSGYRCLLRNAGTRTEAEISERCGRAASLAYTTSSQHGPYRRRFVPANHRPDALCL